MWMKYRKTKPRKFEKLPSVAPKLNSGCAFCGAMAATLPMTAEIAVGFGSSGLYRDNRPIWVEHPDDCQPLTVTEAEAIAAADPEHDWRIEYNGPLAEKEYQRQDTAIWVLVRTGLGFA